jgi:hypothetical protein
MGERIEIGKIVADVYYDESDPSNKGWYALYSKNYGHESRMLDDSQKVWHPEMPRRRNAKAKALRIARSYARQLARTSGGKRKHAPSTPKATKPTKRTSATSLARHKARMRRLRAWL